MEEEIQELIDSNKRIYQQLKECNEKLKNISETYKKFNLLIDTNNQS
jgi:hypothetical protein